MKLPVIFAATTLLALAGCQSDNAANLDFSKLTAEQKTEIGVIAGEYITQHPEYLVKASQALREQQEKQQTDSVKKATVANLGKLIKDPTSPFVGPADAKVTVVQFFDYQCIMCARAAAPIQKLIDANPDVKFVFKESPIFAQRWEASKYSAEAGLWMFKKYGSEAYLKFHDGVFATGKNEGKLTIEDVNKQIQLAGGDSSLLKAGEGYMQNLELFQKLGLTGTPTLMFMPTEGATAENIVIIPGLAPDRFESAIKQIKGNLAK